jgi:hypothetical protein
MLTRIEIDKFDDYYMTLPEELVRELDWESGDEIDIAIVVHNETGDKHLVCTKKRVFAKPIVYLPGEFPKEIEISQYVKKLSQD